MSIKNTTITADRIKEIRLKLNMGIRELAREIGSSPATVCYWEQGKRAPSLMACYKIISLAKKNGIAISKTLPITIEWLRPKDSL